MSLESFTKQQERMRTQFAGVTPGLTAAKLPVGIGVYEEQVRQNMALFDRAMKMFSPFAYARPEDAAAAASSEPTVPAPQPSEDSLADLKRQLEVMQQQIEKLATKP